MTSTVIDGEKRRRAGYQEVDRAVKAGAVGLLVIPLLQPRDHNRVQRIRDNIERTLNDAKTSDIMLIASEDKTISQFFRLCEERGLDPAEASHDALVSWISYCLMFGQGPPMEES